MLKANMTLLHSHPLTYLWIINYGIPLHLMYRSAQITDKTATFDATALPSRMCWNWIEVGNVLPWHWLLLMHDQIIHIISDPKCVAQKVSCSKRLDINHFSITVLFGITSCLHNHPWPCLSLRTIFWILWSFYHLIYVMKLKAWHTNRHLT